MEEEHGRVEAMRVAVPTNAGMQSPVDEPHDSILGGMRPNENFSTIEEEHLFLTPGKLRDHNPDTF